MTTHKKKQINQIESGRKKKLGMDNALGTQRESYKIAIKKTLCGYKKL